MSFQKENVYITTTIPYVNAEPHIGFALEIVQADCLARFKRKEGFSVFFSTGTDEYGLKIWQKAREEEKDPQVFVDINVERFKTLLKMLDISNDSFIRTTNPKHIEAAQEFWRKADENGDVYKKKYRGLYCVSDEMFLTERDLVDGKCPNHPDQEPALVEEENYFFKLSHYSQLLRDYIETSDTVIPEIRKNEALSFIERGLEDFSISRLSEKLPWGIPVPGDEEHTMYVWFGAFVNYLSTLGWPESDNVEKFWLGGTKIQVAGKDMVRFQSLMWQAMLASVGLPLTDHIFYHGFVTSGGRKMSKSVGNVVSPFDIVEEYGSEALRYFLLRHVHPFEDSDFTPDRFQEIYNANLANGIGNLTSRIITMAREYGVEVVLPPRETIWKDKEWDTYKDLISQFEFNKAADIIWAEIGLLDAYIAESEPYKMVKENKKKAQEIVAYLILRLHDISVMLEPLMPQTSSVIQRAVEEKEIKKPLFLRK